MSNINGDPMLSASLFGVPVVTSEYVPTTDDVVKPDARPLLSRIFSRSLYGVRVEKVPCDFVFLVDGRMVTNAAVVKKLSSL